MLFLQLLADGLITGCAIGLVAVSFSLMFEAGGQPISGAGGPVTEPIQNGAPDLPTNSFFEYGFTEGIPLTRQRSLFYLTTGNAVALSEDSYGNV